MARIYIKSNSHKLQKFDKSYTVPVGLSALKKRRDNGGDIEPLADEEKLSPSESVYAFAAWLTSRKQKTVMSAADLATPAADRVNEFVKANKLKEPRESYHKNIVHPD